MNQNAAIKERYYLYTGRKKVFIQFLHLFVDAVQRRVRIRAFAQQHDAFDHVVVVDDSAVLVVNRFAIPAQADLRTLRDGGDVLDPQRRSVLSLDRRFFDVAHGLYQTDGAHVHLLKALLDEASARVHVVIRELLLHLADAQPV